MGYHTDFTLTASICTIGDGFYTTTTIPKIMFASLEDEIGKLCVFDMGGDDDFCFYVNTTWYSWESDMCLLSSRFPEILFCLHGEGENGDDLWNAYFLDGKFQYCPAIITYDSFDPSELCVSKMSTNTQCGSYSQQRS